VKPAADYEAADGTILLEAEHALPCAYRVTGTSPGNISESLELWTETECDRLQIVIRPESKPAGFHVEIVRDHRGRKIGESAHWRGLPNSHTALRFAHGEGGQFTFAFDTSTDLAAWLTPRPSEVR
jgi:hypothetical protein